LVQISLCLSESRSFSAFIPGSVSQPFSRISSAKLSRVPEVGGGPYIWIGMAGRPGLTSRHVRAVCGRPNGFAARPL
jgi:hypothetical protein